MSSLSVNPSLQSYTMRSGSVALIVMFRMSLQALCRFVRAATHDTTLYMRHYPAAMITNLIHDANEDMDLFIMMIMGVRLCLRVLVTALSRVQGMFSFRGRMLVIQQINLFYYKGQKVQGAE